MSSFAELDQSNVVDIDLGSAEFKANAHRHMVEWARRPPFYVLGHGQPQVVVGRYVDVHKGFSLIHRRSHQKCRVNRDRESKKERSPL